MARTLAELPKGSRITDYISLGVVAKTYPREKVDSVLAATGKASCYRESEHSAAGPACACSGLLCDCAGLVHVFVLP